MTTLPPVARAFFYVLIVIGLLGCWTFVIMYTRTWRWWHNDIGRHLVSFSVALGLFMAFYTLRIFWRDMPGSQGIGLTLFVLLDAVIVWRLVLFLQLRRDVRRRERLRREERTDEVD